MERNSQFMSLPKSMVDALQKEEMLLVAGGSVGQEASTTNNADGTCSGTNNDSGKCSGTNDTIDECGNILVGKEKMVNSDRLYNVVVNTTLDCNLSCWYCYENRIVGSKLSSGVIEAIKKNIYLHYETTKFKTLKLSFFGGEPFLYFDGIKQLLDYSNVFCSERSIELIADFTTNSTLITIIC